MTLQPKVSRNSFGAAMNCYWKKIKVENKYQRNKFPGLSIINCNYHIAHPASLVQ